MIWQENSKKTNCIHIYEKITKSFTPWYDTSRQPPPKIATRSELKKHPSTEQHSRTHTQYVHTSRPLPLPWWILRLPSGVIFPPVLAKRQKKQIEPKGPPPSLIALRIDVKYQEYRRETCALHPGCACLLKLFRPLVVSDIDDSVRQVKVPAVCASCVKIKYRVGNEKQ